MNKKEYIEPQMEVVTINNSVQLLAGSGPNSVAGNVFDGTITGSSGSARAPELDDLDW
jgi:hypothetical protein